MPQPRHVIWITTDHMRYDGVGALGNPAMHTPNLDRLVRGGVSFERCYAQNPLCMPSRCSFMTGLYPQQTGVTENGHGLPPDFTPTVATAFKAAGFQTAQIGKLHFQPHEEHDLDPRARHAYGFDHVCLAEEPGCYDDAYTRWLRQEHPGLVETFRVPRPVSAARTEERHGYVLDAPWQASFSGWIANQFERYFCTWGGRHGAPQFVHLGFYAPHPPLNPTREMFEPYRGAALPPARRREAEWGDKPEPLAGMLRGWAERFTEAELGEYRRHFYAMVTGVDLAVGDVMQKLEAAGVLDDTLVVFGSDHGDLCGDHGGRSKGISFYDEIMRLPLVLHWPNGLGRAPRAVEGLAEMVDVLPTLLGLCGAPVPGVMAGRNYAPALLAGGDVPARSDAFAYHEPGHMMLRTDTHKYIRYAWPGGDTEVLYDLAADPDEFVNIAGTAAGRAALPALRERALSRALQASRSAQRRVYRF
jgi:arylsulfatase A-like enzyme